MLFTGETGKCPVATTPIERKYRLSCKRVCLQNNQGLKVKGKENNTFVKMSMLKKNVCINKNKSGLIFN